MTTEKKTKTPLNELIEGRRKLEERIKARLQPEGIALLKKLCYGNTSPYSLREVGRRLGYHYSYLSSVMGEKLNSKMSEELYLKLLALSKEPIPKEEGPAPKKEKVSKSK